MSYTKWAVIVAAIAVVGGPAAAAAQAPVVTKAGPEAVMIQLVGRRTPGAPEETTTVLAGREEMQRFVARARAARAQQGAQPCGARYGAASADAPTLGGALDGWTLRLTCTEAAPAEWRLVYANAAGDSTRVATLGNPAAADAWLARVGALVAGPRVQHLKPFGHAEHP